MDFNPSIIVVDNEESELTRLSLEFSKVGIPCLALHYDNSDFENGPIPLVENTYCTRIICIDINLQDRPVSNTEDLEAAKQLFSGIKSVFDALSVEGPVFVVFWSKHHKLSGYLIELLKEREPDIGEKIIGYSSLDKTDYGHNDADLKGDLLKVISENSTISSLINLEQNIANSIQKVFSSIFQSSAHDHDIFVSSIAALANNAVGKDSAKASPLKAISAAVLPLLNDKILTNSNSELDTLLKTALEGKIGDDIEIDETIKLALNTSISAELVNPEQEVEVIERGSFYSVNHEQLYRLFDVELTTDQKEAGIGFCRLSKVILPDFINTNLFKEKNTEHQKALEKHVQFGVIELSAACDQNQNNRLVHPLALAVLVEQEFYNVIKNSKRNVTKNDTTYQQCPGVFVEDIEKHLRVSGKYTFGIGAGNDIFKSTPILRYRDHIVEHILEFCTKHSSRGGIFTIR